MIAPGTVLQNRYLVERQIGAGGMGAVYIATDQRFGSTVALKETFFDDPNLRRAFEREAKLLNHLRHSALPRVSDHFSEGEGQFLVMEYMPGEDLSNMLKARGAPFAVRDVLAWADQLLDALEYLHTQTQPVVHRDIKPQNLKLLPRNQIVLLDFGLAKGTPLQTRVTATGSVFGYSFNYAPIEQMQGTGTDPRSDLYSLAATVYHLLTYTTPPDALTRATALVNGEPDPLRPANELNPRVPAAVADALARALEQSAARRFSSAEEMRGTLREAASFVGEEATNSALDATMTDALASPTNLASEQNTQLMQGEAGGATSPLAPRGKGTEAVNSRDAATLLSAAVAGNESAANSAKVSPSAVMSAPQPLLSAKREDDSVVTHVKTKGSAPASRTGSRRALGLAAGVIIVALVAAVAYSLANRSAQTTPAVQPTPQLVAQPAPASPQPTADTQQAAAPSPTHEVKPATADEQPRPAPPAKNEKPQEARPPASEARPPAPPAHATPPDEDAQDDAETDAIFRNRDWVNNPPSDEEMRRWSEQHPRRARMLREKIREERRHAMEERRRAMDEQRRNGGDTRPPMRRPPGRRSPP